MAMEALGFHHRVEPEMRELNPLAQCAAASRCSTKYETPHRAAAIASRPSAAVSPVVNRARGNDRARLRMDYVCKIKLSGGGFQLSNSGSALKRIVHDRFMTLYVMTFVV
jgi:hypothetical protein